MDARKNTPRRCSLNVCRLGALLISAAVLGLPGAGALAKEATWISDKPVTLSIHMHFRDKFVWDTEWPVAKELTRLTNVQLVGTANKSATNSADQFAALMESDRFPDIVAGDSLKEAFIQYGMEGVFIPLNRLIDQHAPNIRAFLKSHPDVEKAITAPDGNIYFIPYVPDGRVSRGYFIRQDWLDRLGLKQPQTVDELYAVLKAFRDKDPNGNGKRDEIPYFNGNPNEVFRLVTLWGARSTGSATPFDFYVENGRVHHPFVEPAFRDGIKQVARWYKEGLIDPDIFTRRSKAREQFFGSNVGGMTHDWFASTAGFNESLGKTIPGFKLVPIAPPADSRGRRWEEDARQTVRPDGWAITLANRKEVETIKLFDFFFSRTGRNLANFGVEGVTWDMKNGKAVFKDSVLHAKTPVNAQMWAIGAQIPIGYWQDYDYERQWTNAVAIQGIDMYSRGNYLIPQFSGVTMTKDERAVYDLYWKTLQDYMSEMAQSWVTGKKDVDQTWNAYMTTLKHNGFYEVMTVMQNAYQRQYRKK